MSALFRSVKFNVILFLLIALLAALGTFIPQVSDNADKVQTLMANHPTWGQLLNAWGVFDIYHTFLFAGLLSLMAFDVVLCKLWNKPPDPGLVPLPQNDNADDVSVSALHKKPYRLEGTADGSVAALSKTFLRQLKSHHYAVKKISLPNGGLALVGSRHRLQRWGSYVSHIALVVILMGAMIKSLLGFETFLPVLEGQSAHVSQSLWPEMDSPPTRWTDRIRDALKHYSIDPLAHWDLWVDKLTVDFYPHSTTPSTFASKVRLYNNETPLADTTIRVNQPLDVRHVRFYQASWGVTGMVTEAILQVGHKTISLGMKESFPVPKQPWTAKIEHYLPDFTIGADGQPTTASLEWKNPVLVLGFYNKRKIRIGTMVLSAPSPITPPDAEPWGMFFFAGGHLKINPPFQVLEVRPRLFSGIQVSYDPGFPVIVGGVIFMLLGLMALFYLHQRRVLIFIRPQKDTAQARVEIGGWSSRGEKEFNREFHALFRSWNFKTVR